MKSYWTIVIYSGTNIHGETTYTNELFFGTEEEAKKHFESYKFEGETYYPFTFPDFIEKGESGVVF